MAGTEERQKLSFDTGAAILHRCFKPGIHERFTLFSVRISDLKVHHCHAEVRFG